jgi:predicted TIM-barrel fold metal-dependent hydrolase
MSSWRVFDIHGHTAHQSQLAARLAAMDRAGITASALMVDFDYEWPNGVADTRRVNDQVAAWRDLYPTRLPVALGTVEPFHGPRACLDEIDRLAGELRLDGVIWDHHAQGTSLDDQRMVTFAREVARRGLTSVVHVHALDMREGPTHVESLARQVPEATLVALGAFSALQRHWELERIARACPNLVFDTTVTLPIGPIDAYVEIVGAERVVFGTDMYANPLWTAPEPLVLRMIVDSEALSESEKQLILWDNAARLFPRLQALA